VTRSLHLWALKRMSCEHSLRPSLSEGKNKVQTISQARRAPPYFSNAMRDLPLATVANFLRLFGHALGVLTGPVPVPLIITTAGDRCFDTNGDPP